MSSARLRSQSKNHKNGTGSCRVVGLEAWDQFEKVENVKAP